jgi:hypothetical protein
MRRKSTSMRTDSLVVDLRATPVRDAYAGAAYHLPIIVGKARLDCRFGDENLSVGKRRIRQANQPSISITISVNLNS